MREFFRKKKWRKWGEPESLAREGPGWSQDFIFYIGLLTSIVALLSLFYAIIEGIKKLV